MKSINNSFHNPRTVDIHDIGYIYLIRCKVLPRDSLNYKTYKYEEWYKIGKTKHPENRLSQYNGSFPYDVYEYDFLSERIYNLSEVERIILSHIVTNHRLYMSENRYEWFKVVNNSGNKSYNVKNFISNRVNEQVDKYYEGE